MLGRRGPHQIAMTPKELGELGHLEDAVPLVDPADFPPVLDDALLEPGLRKSVTHLRDFANLAADKTQDHNLRFLRHAGRRSRATARSERLIVERTGLDDEGAAIGTGETYTIPCGLVVSCIGYQTPPIEGVAYDEQDRGRFANEDGVDRRRPLLRRLGAARADRDDRHQPARRL